MTFQQTSDVELWAVNCHNGWRIPIHATPGEIGERKGLWLVSCAMPILSNEYKVLGDTIEPHNLIEPCSHWLIEDVSRIASKAAGITPEWYLHTDRPVAVNTETQEVDPVPVNPPEPAEIRYPKFVFEQSGLDDWAGFLTIYNMIVTSMPRYMMKTRKSVDLGWCKISAFPLRANWKHILLAKFPNFGSVCSKPINALLSYLKMSGFGSEVRNTEMLAVSTVRSGDKSASRIQWTLDISPTKHWRKYEHTVESRSALRLSPDAYLSHVGGVIDAQWRSIVEAFVSFVEDSGAPIGDVVQGGTDGSSELRQSLRSRRVAKASLEGYPVAPIVETSTRRISGVREGAYVPFENPFLSDEVPPVPQGASDVR